MKRTVMAVAVHPDDETLGCGGTLLKHRQQGDDVHWLIATEMNTGAGYNEEQIAARDAEIEQVAAAYQFSEVHRLGLPVAKVDTLPLADVVGKLSALLARVKPDILYLPFKSDVHSDHRILFDCLYSCSKSFRVPFLKRVLMMETISETEFAPPFAENAFMPNSFVDISDHLEKKLNIFSLYKSEVGRHPFPRSLENLRALALYRGAMAQCHYAESFVLLKERW